MYTTVKRRFEERARKAWKKNKDVIEGIRLGAYKVVDVWAEEQNKAESEAKVSRLYGI